MYRVYLTLACCVLGVGVARADDEPAAAPTAAPAPAATATTSTQQLTIPKGGIVIDGFVVMNLSNGAAFKPVSLSPDIWYGATDDLTLGLVHSSVGSFGFIGIPATSLCLTGSSNGCRGFYDNVGADVRYRLQAPWNVDGGLFLYNIASSAQLAVKAGISGRWRFDKVTLELQPSLLIYLTNRADGGTVMMKVVQPATELLAIPVTGAYEVAPKIEIGAQTGLLLPFSNTSNAYSVPFSLLGRYAVSPQLSIGVSFTLLALIANNGGFDGRSLSIGGSYAM